MKNINEIISDNTGGLEVCFFTEWENILFHNFPAADGLRLTGEVQLKPDAFWYSLLYTRFTSEYEEQSGSDRRGTLYQQKQQGFIPRDSPELGSQLFDMKDRRYALLFRDRNGYLRLAGSPGHSLKFNYKLATGADPSSRNGYQVSFDGEGLWPAFYYSGSFRVSEIGLISPPVAGVGAPVKVRFNGSTVKILQPGEILDVSSEFTLEFDINFI